MISTFTYTADRDTRIDFSRAYYKATGRLLVKNDGAVQKLADIAGKKVATTSGSVYDRWMKNCFKSTEVVVADTFTNAMLAFNQGRADAVMYDDAVLLPVAAADRNAKLTDDAFLEAPFGIGIKQGNTALKAWVDSRLNLMQKKDQFLPILKANVAARFVNSFSKNVLRPNNTFTYAAPGGAERGDGLPVAEPEGGGRTAASLATRCFRTTTSGPSSPTTGTSSSRGSSTRSRSRRSRSPAPSSIGLVLGAARAHRVPVVSQFTAVYVEVIRNTPILVQIFMIFYGLPAVRDHVRRVHGRLALGDALGRRVQQRELPRRLPRRLAPASRGGLRARLRAAGHVPERDAPARRPHRAAVVDQHLHLRDQEHVADVRDRATRS